MKKNLIYYLYSKIKNKIYKIIYKSLFKRINTDINLIVIEGEEKCNYKTICPENLVIG